MEKLREIRNTLNRSIFVGERYERNIRSMMIEAYIIIALGVVMFSVNLAKRDYLTGLSPLMFLLDGLLSFYFLKVKRSRKCSVIACNITVILVFTFDILYISNGFAFLWTLLVPLSVCYFIGVKEGILLTSYFQLLYTFAFYTPLRRYLMGHFSQIVLDRFPLLYFFNAVITIFVMYQYHKSVLFEIDHTNRLNEEVARQTAAAEARSQRIEEMSIQTIQTLAHAIDAKDPYTQGHSTRVSRYSVMIAEALGWDRDRVRNLRCAALLHDIGKIGVPDSILNSPRRLTNVEYSIIKAHTTTGGDILHGGTMIDIAEDVALSHHARYDGQGYPRGLRGEEISEEARIVAIADAFDAMSSNRVYRRACDRGHIRNELMEGRGKQFDPVYVDVLITLWDRGLLDDILCDVYSEDDRSAEVSTALLQQALMDFVRENDNVDRLAGDILGDTGNEGAIDVAYPQFAKLYEYIANLGSRFNHPFALVMIELKATIDDNRGSELMRRAMDYMELAIRQTVRNVDVITRYGDRRFLVILVGTGPEGIKTAMDRIFRGYYKMNGNGDCAPSYTVAQKNRIDESAFEHF